MILPFMVKSGTREGTRRRGRKVRGGKEWESGRDRKWRKGRDGKERL